MNKIALMILFLFVSMYGAVRTDTVVVSGPISGATLNTGNGANELYEMDQNVKSTDSINGLVFKASRIRTPLLLSDSIVNSTGISTKRFIARSGTYGDPANSGTSQPYLISRFIGNDYSILDIGEYSSGGSYWIQVCDALSLGTSYSFCINPNGGNIGINKKNPQYPLDVTGEGRFTAGINASDLRVSDSVKAVSGAFSGAITGTTLNTGNGANELYAMDQNVRTTDSINALTNKATRGHFDSLKLGDGSYLKTYLDTTFYDTLYNVETYIGRGLARIVCIGNVVTLYQPSITGTTSGPISIQGIPTKFLPSLSTSVPAMIRNNSNTEVGIYLLNSIYGFSILTSNFANPSDGTSGTRGCTVTWIIN